MRVTEHVEHLLRQGRKPKELVELGFSRQVVTRVRRRLRKEKAAPLAKVSQGVARAESHLLTPAQLSEQVAAIQQELRTLEDKLRKTDSLVKELLEIKVLVAAAQQLGTYRHEKCPYQKDGFCTWESWESENEVPQDIGEPVLVENEKNQWYIKPSPFYCAMCTISLEVHLDEMDIDVSGNPLSGAKYQITCKGCGKKGWIAAAIKCTKCGYETYWGWWPKKE